MALGGQGAPLAPAFHQVLFGNNQQDVFIINIGGIANITYLPADKKQKVLGYDTGPGNALMDDWFQKHHHGPYDVDGLWAASGTINQSLLTRLLDNSYFARPAPKSTGREVFHMPWLAQHTAQLSLPAADVQATLCALTAETIAGEITGLSASGNIYLCGGGTHNKTLKKLLIQKLKSFNFEDTSRQNIDIDALEAMAFAWLAYAFDKKITGNIPAVTGASQEAVLGSPYFP